jgi:hypothetical protein
MSYEVHGLEYETFEEVVEYAWDEFKIDIEADFTKFSEEEKQRACKVLTTMLEYEDLALREPEDDSKQNLFDAFK